MYRINRILMLRFVLIDVAIIGVISYLFYESVVAFILMLPSIIILYKIQKRREQQSRKNRVREEFKDVCIAISSSISTGYSMENALKSAVNELSELYGNKSIIAPELNRMINKVAINTSVEKSFSEFADSCDIEEIKIFAEILTVAKRSSGNLQHIIKNTAESIGERIDLMREVDLIFASKRYEQKIMNIIPMIIIIYVKVTSPQMLVLMYTGLTGRIIMSVCLTAFIGAIALSEKIMEMKI